MIDSNHFYLKKKIIFTLSTNFIQQKKKNNNKNTQQKIQTHIDYLRDSHRYKSTYSKILYDPTLTHTHTHTQTSQWLQCHW